jgi:RNA polymerase sigma-70 factor (ECF subfamily)
MDSAYTNSNGENVSIDIESSERDPEEVVIHLEKVKTMREVVKTLKPRYRDLIEKRYFEELSYEEIAKEMDLPLGTVKAQLFRARAFLADLMKKTKESI